jgi:hypothetical protein
MKLGLSQVPYKYKLLGEQVAYVIDDMLTAVEQGRTTIDSTVCIKCRAQSDKLGYEAPSEDRGGLKKGIIVT